MAQVLRLDKSRELLVDRTFYDMGKKADMVTVGGHRILVAAALPAKPMIHQRGTTFFYSNGEPVTTAEDVDWLPEPHRTTALAFVERAKGGTAKKSLARPAAKSSAAPASPARAAVGPSGRRTKPFDPAAALGRAAQRPLTQAELARRAGAPEPEPFEE